MCHDSKMQECVSKAILEVYIIYTYVLFGCWSWSFSLLADLFHAVHVDIAV